MTSSLIQTCNQHHSLKLTCINLSRQHSASQGISLKRLLRITTTTKKPRCGYQGLGQVIQQNALQKEHWKMVFQLCSEKCHNTHLTRILIHLHWARGIHQSFATEWSFSFSDLRPVAKELLSIIKLLPPILLIKPVVLLHSETLDMGSPASWPAPTEISGVSMSPCKPERAVHLLPGSLLP